MNNDNLRALTTEEAREIGKTGGVASAESRKRKKAMQEVWEAVRKMPLATGKAAEIHSIKSIAAAKNVNLTIEQAMLLAMVKKAIRGDVRAFQVLQRYTGIELEIAAIAAKKADLELTKLAVEVEALKRYEAKERSGVVILDDLP